MERVLLITGAPRSGTSMTAGIFYLCGAFGGLMSAFKKGDKKRSTFENVEIKFAAMRPYFEKMKKDVRGQNPIPSYKDLTAYPSLRIKVRKILQEQSQRVLGHSVSPQQYWFYKDSRIVLTWPIWMDAFPEAVWIIVRRKSDDIVESCMKTGYMDAFLDCDSWKQWVGHFEQKMNDIKMQTNRFYEVWPEKFVNGDYTEIKNIVHKLKMDWNESLVKEFINPQIWRKK